MVWPAVTGSGVWVLVMPRLADVVTVATSVAQLLAGAGSASLPCTQASFCSVPRVVEDTVATTVTVMDWPGRRVPGPQVRVAGPVAGTGAHVPCVEVAAVTVMPVGTESVMFTLVAEDGPWLVATMV